MPSRTSKFRGSRTHGRGPKAGRGHGKRGGRGNAGLHKHKFKSLVKYAPDHFGRHGFKRPPEILKEEHIINLRTIETNFEKWKNTGYIKEEQGKFVVDLTALGYTKLLGTGKLTRPMIIKVEKVSRNVEEKLKENGSIWLPSNKEQTAGIEKNE